MACAFDASFVSTLDRRRLPGNWRSYPAPPALQQIGDEWIAPRERRTRSRRTGSSPCRRAASESLGPAAPPLTTPARRLVHPSAAIAARLCGASAPRRVKPPLFQLTELVRQTSLTGCGERQRRPNVRHVSDPENLGESRPRSCPQRGIPARRRP
jgi:hypothetical protein